MSLRLTALAVVVAGVLAGCGSGEESADASIVRDLGVRQLVGQRMVYAYDGVNPPAALRTRIRRGEAAGVILFGRNVRSAEQLRATLRRLQSIPRPRGLRAPLLVLVDQEGGTVRRVPGGPSRMAPQLTSTASARAAGRAAGRALRAVGANVNLAPVADVARDGSAMRRERRAFRGHPGVVARLASAYAAGLAEQRVPGTYKHFPGFGAAGRNTDDAPVRISTPLEQLRRIDGHPYRSIPRGVGLVMLSTAVYPALDPRPAAFSRRWVTDELRNRYRFRGVTIADDLETPAVAGYGAPSQLAFFAVSAGVDVPLFARTYRGGAQAAEGLVRAARQGRISRGALEASATRVLRLRRSLPASPGR
jgi:beta-N-acetylhexosaminidase